MQMVVVEGGNQHHGRDAQKREHALAQHKVVAVAVIVVRVGVACGKQHDKPERKQHQNEEQHGHVKAEAERENFVADALAPPHPPHRRGGGLVFRDAHRRAARHTLQPAGRGSSRMRHIDNHSFFSDFPPAARQAVHNLY